MTHTEKEFRCQIFLIFSVFAKYKKPKAILSYMLQVDSYVFYQHLDVLQMCCWDLPVLYSFASVLVWTQTLKIDKRPFWKHLFLRCINELWRISKRFSLWSPKSPVSFTFFPPHHCSLLALHCQRALGAASFQCLDKDSAHSHSKHAAEHHSTHNSIFKISFSMGSNKFHGMDRSGVPKTISMSKGTCAALLSELFMLCKPPLRFQPRTTWGQQQLWGNSWRCCSTSIFRHTKRSLRLPSHTLDFSMERLGMCQVKRYRWK